MNSKTVQQLAATAIISSVVSISALLAYQSISKRFRRARLEEEIREQFADEPGPPNHSESTTEKEYDANEAIIKEQLARNYTFFGEVGMTKIRASRVVVIGCGGVGSWASVMLVRSGISYIRLVDFDYVTLSSLNRHATATLADVGTPKVRCIERTLKSIANWITVDSCVDVWKKEEGGHYLRDVDWVIDAIDNITTKVDLLAYCHKNNIKVFSSMGAGAKSDPTRIQISDIADTVYDPLARSVRRRLRAHGINGGIPVVYSTEVPGDVKLLPLPEEEFQKGSVHELGALDDFRVRILPVLGPLPSIFGLNIATCILCELADKPIQNPMATKGRKKLYEKLYAALLVRESKNAGHQISKLPIDEIDIAFIFEDLHRGRSVVFPHNVPARPVLLRWYDNQPLTLENCVVMDNREADLHVMEGPERWDTVTQQVVRRRQEEARKYRSWIM